MRRYAVSLASAIALYGLITAGLSTTLSLFLADAVRASPVLIGLFFTARAAAGIGVGLVTGWISDRIRDRRVMLGLTGLSGAVGALCLSVSHDYALVLVACVGFASLGQAAFAQLFAYANEFASAGDRDVTAFTSIMRSVFSAAYVVGPPLGLSVVARYGFRPLYLVVAGVSLASAVIGRWGLCQVPRKAPPADPPGAREHPGSWRLARGLSLLPARTWALLSVVLVLGAVNQMYTIDISLHVTKDLGESPQLVGWMLALTAGLEIPVMVVVGRATRRIGSGPLVGLSALLATVNFCLLPLVASAVALLSLAALQGLWQGIALSLPMVMVQDEAPGGVGTSSALYGAAFGMAGMIGGAVTGATAPLVGYDGVFWVCAALSAVAVVLMMIRFTAIRPKAVVPVVPGLYEAPD